MTPAYPTGQGTGRRAVAMVAAAVIMYGCAGGNGSSAGKAAENQQGIAVSTDPPASSRTIASGPETGAGQQVVTSPTSVAIPVDARPAALVNGKTVDWGELRPLLNEAAGAEVLREIVLDRRIGEALAASKVTISADDVAGERKILMEELDPNPNHAVRLLDELRDRQKLGPQRFERLLRRNAALRKLAADRVEVTEMMLREQFDVFYGPTRQARIIVTPTLTQAESAISEVRGGASFADVATRRSSDLSAARGGLLEPISVSNQLYAKALRDALWALPPGEISNPIMVDNRFAVLQLVAEDPAFKANFDTERPRLERIVRLAQERLVMDQLARQMMADNSVTIFDESLNQAWDAARRRPKQP